MDDTARRLWAQYRRRRTAARRNALVEHYLPRVARIARHVASRLAPSIDRDELAAAGAVGLIGAVTRFDPRRGSSFDSFAFVRIRGAMLDWLRATDWATRRTRSGAAQLRQAVERDEQALGRRLTAAERDACGPEPPRQLSLDVPGGEERAGTAWAELLEDPRPEARPATHLERQEFWERLACGLSARERIVLRGLYFERRTMAELARTLGLSEPRISQIRAAAIAHLRRKFSGAVAPLDL